MRGLLTGIEWDQSREEYGEWVAPTRAVYNALLNGAYFYSLLLFIVFVLLFLLLFIVFMLL
jgi:hypothetical protein